MTQATLSEEGFHIGAIYTLRAKDVVELMPRRDISYVSARYQAKPVYLAIGVLLLLAVAFLAANDPITLRQNGNLVFGAAVVGALFVIAYFGSRRVGIVIASAGGRLFVETRGRSRLALLERIHADLTRQHT